MSQMLPETGEVMSGAAFGDVGRPPLTLLHHRPTDNKELLRQQLLSAKERNADKNPDPSPKKPQRNRQKNRWKLKFHHQALPQEYLDHYQQTLQKQDQKKQKEKKPHYDLNNITNESFNLWSQRLASAPQETTLNVPVNNNNMPKTKHEDKRKKAPAIQPSKIITYDDLPYMGEMTLNNSKPRRGRKPKKADICHLIYENYGTVVPGQPPPQIDSKMNQLSTCPTFKNSEPTPKTDLQNKIISSLLEKKLCQEKRRLESCPPSLLSPDSPMPAAPPTIAGPLHNDEEPLNLCIRDLHELKIQIQKKFGNIYPSISEVKSEPEDLESPRSEQPNAISVIQRTYIPPVTARSSPDMSQRSRPDSPGGSEPGDRTPQYMYWPQPYLHPLALQSQLLYYQRLAAGQLPYPQDDQESTSSESPQSSPSIDESKNKLVLKQISELLDPNVADAEGNNSPDQNKMKRLSPNPVLGPVKRKRSAIFIPPVPAKSNTTTPTTEVSICKFKFTGGSKPSLQEKKMLSVDSGGNFRYYSGTGTNKGNKGYEYLQRDAKQNRVHEPSVPAIPTDTTKEDGKKKRKSRKSLQREKLEQTFKEKGFLIQTQQLQSAEGATYCKFRQLRKFTRYLFRSWKDYLPGELDEKNKEARQEVQDVEESKQEEGNNQLNC